MDAETWDRLQSIFLAALERPPDQRPAFLDSACADDGALRAEAAAMLAAHARVTDNSRRDTPPIARGGDSNGHHTKRLGPYLLRDLIGRGGMGEVFRAQRVDDAYRQVVAIKLLRSGLACDELAHRFRVERQILARLQHPSIATLLDGGMDEDDRPYLVMQYVDGRPITDYADDAKLPIAERLRLFGTVCRAVHFAHRNLVVHRDLKPSNILVDSDGNPCLLDFGIAKLLDPAGLGVSASLTRDHLLLTPEHAAPEQVLGGVITTATDVYALGVLLYELLTGTRPFRASAEVAWQREVCEQDPLPPSAVLDAPDTALTAVRRGTRPAALRQTVRGDLDQIVLKALRKEPDRRYASAEQLAEDVERFLEQRPVLARPDTVAYRVRRFVRRNRAAVAAAAAVVLALVAGLSLALLGQKRALQAERLARDEAATSSQISDFLIQLFQSSDPGVALGESVTARELLDRGALRIEEQLGEQPIVRARLLRTMGRAYLGLGLFDPAQLLLEQELAVQRARGRNGVVDGSRASVELAGIHASKGDYPRARELALGAVAVLEREVAPEDPDLLRALNTLARVYGQLGDYAGAGAILERVVEIHERNGEPEHIDLYSPLNNLAIVRWRLGDFEGARSRYERALRIVERHRGTDDPSAAHTLNNLALVHRGAGDAGLAIATHERALAIRRKILGPNHPDIGESLNNLGVVFLDTEEFDRARAHFEEALAIRERAIGADHPHTASTRSNLGSALLGSGDHAAATVFFESALASLRTSVGSDHVMTSYPLLGLARLDASRGATDVAERRYREVIAIREAALGPNHPDVEEARRGYATLLRAVDRSGVDSLGSIAHPPN
jgi:eukaryotic-like serine/threonine-protein kinase